jgi:hypothetical protein
MNRNIITEADVQRVAPKAKRPGDLSANASGVTTIPPKVDTYFDRLTKYIPMEIIGAYLVVEGLLKELLKTEELAVGLLVLFLLGMLSTWFFARRVLNVVRTSQLTMSAFAFFVWVFATGGWFVTLEFWAPGWGTIAVVVFAVMVRILNIGPLPDDQGMQAPIASP